jgi:transposase-like protein
MTHKDCTKNGSKSQGENGDVFFDDSDRLKDLVASVIQEIIDTEFLEYIGVEPYDRQPGRRDYRNGFKPRRLKTRVGEIELSIPQARNEPFRTQMFRRYQRSERAFLLSLQEMIIQGVSTRKVRKITEKLCGITFSKSTVSKLTTELDGDIQAWLQRPLTGFYPYLIVDAEYEKVRENHKVLSEAAIIIKGVHESGRREVLHVSIANSENGITWSEAFIDLKRRGLKGVQLVVSDAHEGLKEAIDRHFQGCLWQRCQFHYLKNVMAKVRKTDHHEVKMLIDDIYHASDIETAIERLHYAVKRLADRYPDLSEFIEETCEETLSVYHFPFHHRRRLRTTNSLERLNEEIRRRTRVVRIFPNRASCLRLVASICMEKSEEWETGHRYLTMDVMGKEDDVQQKSPVTTFLPTSAESVLEPILQKI